MLVFKKVVRSKRNREFEFQDEALYVVRGLRAEGLIMVEGSKRPNCLFSSLYKLLILRYLRKNNVVSLLLAWELMFERVN